MLHCFYLQLWQQYSSEPFWAQENRRGKQSILGTRNQANLLSSSCPTSTDIPTNQTSTPSASPSSSTTTPFTAPTGITVALDCPSIDTQTINENYIPTSTFFKYQITCGADCQGHDLVATWAYSLDMCVDACVSFTRNNYTGTTCGAVAFRADMGNVTNLGGNCYLKEGGCVPVVQDVMIAHAVLLSLPFS